VGLAARTMTVAAGVITDGLMTASRAGIHMSTEQRRAAAQDGHEHFQMQPGEPTAALCKNAGPASRMTSANSRDGRRMAVGHRRAGGDLEAAHGELPS